MSWGQRQRRSPGSTAFQFFVVWGVCRAILWKISRLLHGLRRSGLENIPRTGPILYVANHCSHYDPPLVGMSVDDRPPAFLARDSLFRIKPIGAFLVFFYSIPIVRGGRGVAGLRAAIAELKEGRNVLVFPEGTRSNDGAMGRCKGGFLILVKRSGATVVPVGIHGAYEAFSRHDRFPHFFRKIHVHVGEPITAETLTAMDDKEAVAHIAGAIASAAATAADLSVQA